MAPRGRIAAGPDEQAPEDGPGGTGGEQQPVAPMLVVPGLALCDELIRVYANVYRRSDTEEGGPVREGWS